MKESMTALERFARAVEAWRGQGRRGRLPESLWEQAVELCRKGERPSRVARAGKLNYDRLKEKLKAPAFAPLAGPVIFDGIGGLCAAETVEIERPDGARLRLPLSATERVLAHFLAVAP